MLTYVCSCIVSGLPPEYDEWASRDVDFDACKNWLQNNHPDMYDEIYPTVDDDGEGGAAAAGSSRKKKKGVKFVADHEKVVRFVKLKRSGKKFISTIIGLEKFGCDLNDAAKIISKKYGTGAAAMDVQY